MRGVRTILVILLTFAAGGGCNALQPYKTSDPFKYGASKGGPFIANITRQYVERDAALPVEAKSARLAGAQKLMDATADEKIITFEGVEAAYNPLRPVFFSYTNADPSLNVGATLGGPTARDAIQGPAYQMDRLLDEERNRLAKWKLIPGP